MLNKIRLTLVAALLIGTASAAFAAPRSYQGYAPTECTIDLGQGQHIPCDAGV